MRTIRGTLRRMAVIPLEAAVVRQIGRLLDSRGAWWIKTTGVSLVGCPDILACYHGVFIGIEVKRSVYSSYGVTKKQKFELQRIEKAGGASFVAYSPQDVEFVLNRLDESL